MEGARRALGRRPVAGAGLVVAAAWLAMVAVECSTAAPWDQGGWYAVLVGAADLTMRGVALVVASVWLVERAAA